MNNIKQKSKLPNQIKKIRKLRGINQKKLAGCFGHSNTALISHWETSRKELTLMTAIKLMLILGVEIHQLFPHHFGKAEQELSENNSQTFYESKAD